MSKAILVLDKMPDVCVNCPLCDPYSDCCVTGKDASSSETKRMDFCPLRSLPEKIQVCLEGDEWDEGIMRGWNDAIEAIEGSGEDGL